MIKNDLKMRFLTKIKLPVLSIIIGLFVFISCHEITQYSEIPEIKYKSHIARDSFDLLGNSTRFVELTFSIIDGDGDFGLADDDTLPPYDTIYNFNFFPTLYEKTDSGFNKVEIAYPNFRIPFVEIDNHKAYKADIKVKMEYIYSFISSDTIKYDFYVVDKALNQSNVVTTPDIIFE